jgi:hypothetical protein
MKRLLTDVEKRFCEENNLDENMALGEKCDDSPITGRHDEFWIDGINDFNDSEILPQLDAIVINGPARFANAIIKFSNAYKFAKKFGIQMIYHRGFDFLRDDGLIDGIRFQ